MKKNDNSTAIFGAIACVVLVLGALFNLFKDVFNFALYKKQPFKQTCKIILMIIIIIVFIYFGYYASVAY